MFLGVSNFDPSYTNGPMMGSPLNPIRHFGQEASTDVATLHQGPVFPVPRASIQPSRTAPRWGKGHVQLSVQSSGLSSDNHVSYHLTFLYIPFARKPLFFRKNGGHEDFTAKMFQDLLIHLHHAPHPHPHPPAAAHLLFGVIGGHFSGIQQSAGLSQTELPRRLIQRMHKRHLGIVIQKKIDPNR